MHLSHNSIGVAGAAAIMAAIPAPPLPASRMRSHNAAPGQAPRSPENPEQAPQAHGNATGPLRARPPKPLWLRMEWNHIEAAALEDVLACEREDRGLVADIPSKRNDESRWHEQNLMFSGATLTPTSTHAAFQRLSIVLNSAGTLGSYVSTPASTRCLRTLSDRYLSTRVNVAGMPAHVRLPWVRCQRQAPAEASVLLEARAAWSAQPTPESQPPEVPHAASGERAAAELEPPRSAPQDVKTPSQPETTAEASAERPEGTGPLLLFPDTSAMLSMLGAAQGTGAATPFTMHLLEVRPAQL